MKPRFRKPIIGGHPLPLSIMLVSLVSACLSFAAYGSVSHDTRPDVVGCVSVPNSFSSPQVKGSEAPASVWKDWHYGKNVTLTVTPRTALIDQSVAIRVNGLEPNEPVTIYTRVKGFRGLRWESHATFVADDKGNVDVAKDVPTYGSYSGVHAMGLIWSMTPQGTKHPSSVLFLAPGKGHPGDTYTVHLQAMADGHVLAKTTLTRRYIAPGVKETKVAQDGLVGNLYIPVSPGPHPAVIVLGGSEGGLHPQVEEAALLAAHGYAALGLAYFQGSSGGHNPRLAQLPKKLADIPLEYFRKAAHWLKRQPGVEAQHVAIMGASKGAEAALITAATYPRAFQAVVATMPTSVVWAGLTRRGPHTSSWTVDDKPLPWVNPVMNKRIIRDFMSGKPVAMRATYAAGLKNTAAVHKAIIPVARIDAPILLISAGDDQIWPSSVMAHQIMQRLAAHHHAYADESLCYAQAGHLVAYPYRPTSTTAIHSEGFTIVLGGDPVAYAYAQQNSWRKVLAFLHSALH